MNYDNWHILSKDEKLSFVIDLVVPWYFNFIVDGFLLNYSKK